jgi:ABC-type branched-subunit amino acid transport system ATPase component
VIIEHDLSLLRAVAPRWVAMDLGTVVASGDPETVAHDPRVVASYLGRDRPRGEPPTL